MAPRRKVRTNPFSMFSVSSNATPSEICDAFDDLLLWTSELRQKIRNALVQFKHIQEVFQATGLWKKSDIPERAVSELPDKIVQNLGSLMAALESALGSYAEPFEEPSPTLAAVIAMAQRRANQVIGSLLEQLDIAEGQLAEGDRTVFTLDSANIRESRSCAIRDSDCYICVERFQDDTPALTHDEGSCKNTFCKECLDAWVRSKLPTCPKCRASLETPRLSHCL